MELLETTQLFLCNLVRAPALQALLLVAHRVDTDAAGSQLVVDRWLLFRTASPQVRNRPNPSRIFNGITLLKPQLNWEDPTETHIEF
jgi:hypothetical protein